MTKPSRPAEGSASGTGRIQSVDRAIALLNAIAAGPPEGQPVANLAEDCALNRATAWRLLATLEHHGLVERDPVSNRYAIGLGVAQLATATSVAGLVRRAHPVLEWACAETGETADLAVPRRLGLAYVDEVAPSSVLTARWIGRQVPVHATSAGKALLAWLPDDEVDSILSIPLAEYTAMTRTDHRRLRKELVDVRARGYAVGEGELETEVNGVSAPVLDAAGRPLAVVSIWGPSGRLTPDRFPTLGETAVEAARRIGRAA